MACKLSSSILVHFMVYFSQLDADLCGENIC